MSRALAESKEQQPQVEYPNFDVQAYIGEYVGRSRLLRLMFVADNCPSAREATTKLLMKAAENTKDEVMKDVRLYRECFKYGKLYLESTAEPDSNFIYQTMRENTVRRTKLEDEIQKWRNLTQKRNSRLAHLENAAFLSRIGEFDQAIQKLMDAKEYASTAEEMIECQVQVIFTSVKQGTLSHVEYEANRLFVTSPGSQALTETLRSQVHACMGLYYLRKEKFNTACSHFLQATRLGNFAQVLSKRDVGVYAALCALAVLKRKQLKVQMLDNAQIMGYLDRAPVVKKLVHAMIDSKYSVVMQTLRNLMKDFQLDYYLHSVAEELVNAVRGKALVQYFEPFSAMDLNRMAKDFGVELEQIEKELRKAIFSGQVKGKIDLANHTLLEYHDVTDRQSLLEEIINEGEAFCRDAAVELCSLALSAKKIELDKNKSMDDIGDEGCLGEMNNNKYRFFGLRKGNRKGKFLQ